MSPKRCKRCKKPLPRKRHHSRLYCDGRCRKKEGGARQNALLREKTAARIAALPLTKCKSCGEPFKRNAISQLYCSQKCISKNRLKRQNEIGREKLRQQLAKMGLSDWVIRDFGFEPEEVRE